MNTTDRTLQGRQPQAVSNALRVLEEVTSSGPGVTAKEIAAQLSMPSATTYRLLNILVAEGYIVRLPNLSGFAPGHKIGVLFDAAVTPTVCRAARAVLAEIRMSVRFGIHLTIFTSTAVRFVDTDPEYPPITNEAFVNRHLYASAVGKLFLASKPDLDASLPRWGAEALTTRTLVTYSDLLAEMQCVKNQEYAIQIGELDDQTACIAVPIQAEDGIAIGGLTLSANVAHQDVLIEHLDKLRSAANALLPLLA